MSIISPVHLVFLAVVALLALGPKRFPEFTRALGHGVREFRDILNGEGLRRLGDEAAGGDAATEGDGAAGGDEADARGSDAHNPQISVEPR